MFETMFAKEGSVTPFLLKLISFIKVYALSMGMIVCVLILIHTVHGVYKAKRVYNSNVSLTELFFISFLEAFAYIVRKVPAIVMAFLLIMISGSLIKLVSEVTGYIETEKKIRELTCVVKNLQRTETVACISLYEKNGEKTSYILEVFAPDQQQSTKQIVEMKGEEFWIDCMVVNFDYSQIASGNRCTISYPYRIWSEKISPRNAYVLNAVPYIYQYGDDVYGIDSVTYSERLKELFEVIRDEEQSKLMGIRSVNGNALHFEVQDGKRYFIKALGTGGITVDVDDSWD